MNLKKLMRKLESKNTKGSVHKKVIRVNNNIYDDLYIINCDKISINSNRKINYYKTSNKNDSSLLATINTMI